MNTLQRSLLTIRRLWVKNVFLCTIIIILGLLLSFSLSVNQAMIQLDTSLMERLAPVVVIEPDEPRLEPLTMDMIQSVAELPYIRAYNLRSTLFFDNLYYDLFIPHFLFEHLDDETKYFIENAFQFQPEWIGKSVIGTVQPQPVEFEVDLFQLTAGRFMTLEEVETGASVVLLPRLFAESNNLSVGDSFDLEYNVPPVGTSALDERPSNDEMLFHQAINFEVVGLFDINEENLIVEEFDVTYVIDLYNRPFIPHYIFEQLTRDSLFAHDYWAEWRLETFGDDRFFQPTQDHLTFLEATFILYHSRDLRMLKQAAREVLPDGWTVAGTNVGFAPIESSMDSMLAVSDLIFWITSASSVIILALIIVLSIRERRYEMGVYLALGEKKKNILKQILIELSIIAVVGLGVSLLFGNLVSNQVSRQLFESEMMYQLNLPTNDFAHLPSHYLMHFRIESLTAENVMDIYNISLTIETVGIVLGVGTLLVLISATIPIFYTLKLSPKDILILNI